MKHKYLLEAGVSEEDMPWNWGEPDDERHEIWKQEREEYGFDERETWSLDYTFRLWFYERLKMYDEFNCVDTSFHTYEHDGKTYTQQECMDFILKTFAKTFWKKEWKYDNDLVNDVLKAYQLIAKILPDLWW